MAAETRTIAGYECNLVVSKDRQHVRRATVLVGPADKPGWRSSDGSQAGLRRRAAKRAVMAELGLDAKHVRVASRYTCLQPTDDGGFIRRDSQGRPLGYHPPQQ